jgi:hypothetical protein
MIVLVTFPNVHQTFGLAKWERIEDYSFYYAEDRRRSANTQR